MLARQPRVATDAKPNTQPAQPQVQQDIEKGPSPPPQVYGTFITKLSSSFMSEKSQMAEQQGPTDKVWWAFGVSLLVVGTIAVYAFVIISAIL